MKDRARRKSEDAERADDGPSAASHGLDPEGRHQTIDYLLPPM